MHQNNTSSIYDSQAPTYTEKFFVSTSGGYFIEGEKEVSTDINAGRPRACIKAISRSGKYINGVQPEYEGEALNIYPGYTEFRPHEPEMNLYKTEFEGFKDPEQKTNKELTKRHDIHNTYLKAYKDPDKMTKKDRAALLAAESRIYIKPQNVISSEKSPRGIITHISKKSARRLKKLMARTLGLDLWIDLTFSDDVFIGMTFQERLRKARLCLEEFEREIKKLGLAYIWKKEIMPRLSGVMVGKRVCHYHVALCGFTEQQKKNYEKIAVQLLTTWVTITRTKNPKALQVALHRDKEGKPSSYRLIENQRAALRYIGKYFGKTEKIEGFKVESIGRAWGYSKNLILADPTVIHLTREESIIIRRLMRKACRLKKSRKFIGILEQLKCGYSTFLFCSEDLIWRLLNRFVPDPFKQADYVPF